MELKDRIRQMIIVSPGKPPRDTDLDISLDCYNIAYPIEYNANRVTRESIEKMQGNDRNALSQIRSLPGKDNILLIITGQNPRTPAKVVTVKRRFNPSE
jgi:hypothetical protein